MSKAEVERYKKRRGKGEFMYVVKPMYIATDVVQGGDHVAMSSESVPAPTESVPRNAEQMSTCHVALPVDRPPQFSYIAPFPRTNRRRKGRLKADSWQQQSNHQMTLRQTSNLNFDGNINSISTYVMDETKGEKGPDGSELPSESESGSGNWASQADGGGVIFENVQVDPMTQHQALLDEEKWLSVTVDDLSSQTGEDPSGKEASNEKKSKSDVEPDVELDVALRREVYIEDVEGVMREEGVSWDWRRRKKSPNCEF
ncbi:MAG: hypothetical protein GY820_18285 [Gammaproteobacteria bacterium]|nr:hypothetical protein [Gammaproteobacteria bacterium]